MKANTGQYNEPKSFDEAVDNLLKDFPEKMEKSALNGVLLGGHTALNLAYERFAKDIRPGKGNTQKSRLAAAEELLKYLQNKSKGLKGISDDESL